MKKWIPVERMVWKFKKYAHYGFFIPDQRDMYGGDFYVNHHHYGNAQDGDKVEAVELIKSKGKKPEAMIVHIVGEQRPVVKEGFIEGIYTGGGDVYGFIDIEGKEKWYFVHERNKNWAQDGNKVRAILRTFKGKDEAVIKEILPFVKVIVIGIFTDNVQFGFVAPDDKSTDIFIAGSRKLTAKTGDRVEVQILRKGLKKPEGKILNILPPLEKKVEWKMVKEKKNPLK